MKFIEQCLRGEWLITADGGEQIVSIYRTALSTGKAERIALALEARDGQPLKNERNFTVLPSGIAVLDVDGPLMRKAELLSDVSGATSYQWISARLDDCQASTGGRRKLVIRANSPGGEAAGCGACAEKIALLVASGWHVEGYVETQAASAMWWLLSQCSHITAHPTAQVGWIGGVRMLIDDSKRDEMQGVRKIELISEGAENKRKLPLDAKVIAREQARIDDWGALFYAAVARGRGVTVAEVVKKYGTGDGMFAAAALDVGLIDEIGNFEFTLAGLTGERTASRPATAVRARRGDTMHVPGEEKLAAGEEWKCAGCKESMGPSADAYCSKCAVDDDDEEDEEDAKALGLDPKASIGARRARMAALVDFERGALAALAIEPGAGAHATAIGKIATALKSHGEIATLRSDGVKRDLRATLERGLQGAPGDAPRVSLGEIQKKLPTVLRGASKKAWVAAMDKLAADADAAKATVNAKQVIEAACSVAITAEDLEAINDYAGTSAPVAASTHKQPERNAAAEAAELDAVSAEVARHAENARKVLDRNKPPAAK